MANRNLEYFIIVDVETAGPFPDQYALLTIGACSLAEPRHSFYIELQPDKPSVDPAAVAVNRLSIPELTHSGTPPINAMQAFADWLRLIVPQRNIPIFTAFNAPFDWMFINDYFQRYLGVNPFGYKALDIKAYYMGMKHVSFEQTSHAAISKRYGLAQSFSHHALEDAFQEAGLFSAILAEAEAADA